MVVLTDGYLESNWCIQELRSAIKYNKPVIVVRYYLYRFPIPFPEQLNDVKYVLDNSSSFECNSLLLYLLLIFIQGWQSLIRYV